MEGRIAEWALLETRAAGTLPLGVLIADEHRLHVRMRPDWRQSIPQENSDSLRDYETYIPEMAEEVGTLPVLNWFETSSTLPIRIAARQTFQLNDADLALEDLYRERVLLHRPAPVNPGVETESAPSRRRTFAALGRFNYWRSYKALWAIATPVIMAALLLLQRHFLLQRYSQMNKPSLHQTVEMPIAISESPLTSFVGIQQPFLSAPLRLREPGTHARRQKALLQSTSARRQFEGELITDVPFPVSRPTILSAAPALGITIDARPQSPLPIPLPATAPYHTKQNRFLHFFSALFHNKTPQKGRGDNNGNERAGGSGRAIQGLR